MNLCRLAINSLPALALASATWIGGDDSGTVQLPTDDLPAVLPSALPLGLPDALAEAEHDEAVIALGRKLFFDPILSVDKTVSCASCHQPEHGFASPDALSLGVHGRRTLRNAPTLYNRVLGVSFMWDGRATTLEEQVLQPIVNEREMGMTLPDVIARLTQHGDYAQRFEQTFGSPPTELHLAAALAGFIEVLWYADSPLDRFRIGEHSALTPAERSGMWFFESRGACWRCHVGANFTDEGFHNTGVGALDGAPLPGRFAVTQADGDRGAFKTPTLRGLAETAPYMHDGSLATLEDVIEFYRQGGHPNSNLDENIKPIEMTADEVSNLAAFLRALSRPRAAAATEASAQR